MASDANRLSIATAVFLGAVLLIGLPATALVHAALAELLAAAGVGPTTGWGALALLVVSLSIGLQLAAEAAALQLHGVDALDRGGPIASLARHLALATTVSLVLGLIAWLAVDLVLADPGWPIAVLATLVAFAAVVTLFRSSSAFTSGFLSTTDDV